MRERVCFEGDAQIGVILDAEGGVISFVAFRTDDYEAISAKVKSVGLALTRDWLRTIERVTPDSLGIVPEVVGVIRPKALTLEGGFATPEGWFSSEEFLMEEDEVA